MTNTNVFIDGGSHLGEGFEHFRKVYPLSAFDYHMYEPNPDCFAIIKAKYSSLPQVTLHNKAIYDKNAELPFFSDPNTLDQPVSEQDTFSVGCSLIAEHNNKYHKAVQRYTVQADDIVEIIDRLRARYETIVLKLDIEGAEYDVLSRLIAANKLQYISKLIVEFHSQYTSDPNIHQKEKIIRKQLTLSGVDLQVWH